MAFINCFPIDDDTGRAVVVEATPDAGDPYLAARRFLPDTPNDSAYIVTGAVPVGAIFQDGFAHDASGNLYALIDDPPSAPNRYYNDGILGDAEGHMCFTAENAIANYSHGWPVDSIGQVCITGGAPPPVARLFDTVVIDLDIGVELTETDFGKLYFGAATDGGGYATSEAAFLAANPGLTLQDFSGIAAPGSFVSPIPSFTGFTAVLSGPVDDIGAVADANFPDPGSAPFCYIGTEHLLGSALTFTFSPKVSAVGMRIAIASGGFATRTVSFYDGVTLLSTHNVTGIAALATFTSFFGYASTPA